MIWNHSIISATVAAASIAILLAGQASCLPGRQQSILSAPSRKSQRPIHFSNSKFNLLIVADTHLLDDQGTPDNASRVSQASKEAVESYLRMEKPDFVVHTGDLVSGEVATSTADVVDAVRQILRPMGEWRDSSIGKILWVVSHPPHFSPVDAKIPFATTKGNHDNDKFSTHGLITDIERKLSPVLSYTRKAPSDVGGGEVGSDNYWLPVYKHANPSKNEAPALLLWFFDSRSGKEMLSRGGDHIDDWVDSSVAAWIERETTSMQVNEKEVTMPLFLSLFPHVSLSFFWVPFLLPQREWTDLPPSILFVHIPVHAMLDSQNSAPYRDHVGGVFEEITPYTSDNKRTYPGLNADQPLSSQASEDKSGEHLACVGRRRVPCTEVWLYLPLCQVPYRGQDRAFLDAFVQSAAGRARVHGIVSGHDHGNDWCAPSRVKTIAGQIIPLCFAKHSGFGGYDHDIWNHGVRVFHFDLSTVASSVNTYVRYLTGEKVRSISSLLDLVQA
jgi:predicted phosphodiesterase